MQYSPCQIWGEIAACSGTASLRACPYGSTPAGLPLLPSLLALNPRNGHPSQGELSEGQCRVALPAAAFICHELPHLATHLRDCTCCLTCVSTRSGEGNQLSDQTSLPASAFHLSGPDAVSPSSLALGSAWHCKQVLHIAQSAAAGLLH